MGKSLKLILASALCMLVSTACGGNSKKETGVNEQTTTNGKAVMAFSIYGHEVRTEKKKVEKWIRSLSEK